MAVGAMIAVLATLVLLLLSPRGTEWQAIDAVKPLALAASVTVACLLTAGAPYYVLRGRAPWPALWLASVLCLLGVVLVVAVIADRFGAADGTTVLTALVVMIPVCCYSTVAIVVTESLLRRGRGAAR
ncbi:hypothetical protein C5C31_08270 [Rathayibacter rathayi]|uniref:Integral membrane protein n=1 Tax=Rathayibacter rathayi TaxID=33887 RepID=A0ABD6W9Z9_RATRA|nr:hypothetical protein C1O28_13955 [Rathayibacter rathayi]PPF14598.1 hypothetical protein C5C04_06485 [Rathayibacter rathayi]PPG11656.1 hypothetical protein C5C11_11910 [Rathayibacter rathayi]PPG65324.1 hypothetical protein C5C16_13440 [Rathayibacter rathayi]PPG66272.1 hypothetical protein C5C02_11665 [Rathayibacter rathayi]